LGQRDEREKRPDPKKERPDIENVSRAQRRKSKNGRRPKRRVHTYSKTKEIGQANLKGTKRIHPTQGKRDLRKKESSAPTERGRSCPDESKLREKHRGIGKVGGHSKRQQAD